MAAHKFLQYDRCQSNVNAYFLIPNILQLFTACKVVWEDFFSDIYELQENCLHLRSAFNGWKSSSDVRLSERSFVYVKVFSTDSL